MLTIFIKNVVFQYKLAVVLAETRDPHLEKMKERISWKTNKILRRTSESNINICSTISSGSGSNNSRSRSIIARLAIDLILLSYGRKTRVGLGISKYSGRRRVSRYVRCPKVPIPYVGWKTRFEKFTRMRYIRANRPIT